MMKKLGVRWMPGLPFLDGERVSHAFGRAEELAAMEAGAAAAGLVGGGADEVPGMALVLVLAQDNSVTIEQRKGEQEDASVMFAGY